MPRVYAYLIFREMAVKHQGMFWGLFCYFNNKVWCGHNFWLQNNNIVIILPRVF